MSEHPGPDSDPRALQFLALRPRLLGLAYRMLGTLADAEDVVQDAWERWSAVPATPVEDPGALLATITTRLCIDRYRRERTRRDAYPGPWLPEPVPTDRDGPLEQLESGRLLAFGVLRLLEDLTPLERAVFVLAEAFDYRAREIADVVQRSEGHCRQLLHRARLRLRSAGPPRCDDERGPTRTGSDPVRLEALLDALGRGAAEEAARLLGEDVSLISDGGGEVPAVRRPVSGRRAVLRLLLGLAGRVDPGSVQLLPVRLNGAPALLIRNGQRLESALLPAWRDGRLAFLYSQRAPQKLARLARRLRIPPPIPPAEAAPRRT